MSRITITLHIDIPEGARVQTPDVEYAGPEEPPELFVPPPPVYDADERSRPAAVRTVEAPSCPQHGAMSRFPKGVNKQGKAYNASWRCAVKDCPTKPVWDRDAA